MKTALLFLATALFAPAAELKLDREASSIRIEAKATGHEFDGELRDYRLRVFGEAGSLEPTRVELEWEFSDLKTGNEDRDAKMLEWLGGREPEGSFRWTKGWVDEEGQRFGQGVLEIHGVRKAVAFRYGVEREGDRVVIDGAVLLDTRDFALPVIRTALVMTVKPELVVRFRLVGEV